MVNFERATNSDWGVRREMMSQSYTTEAGPAS
jgi:hypothetical protein